jgi:hypothetical protein
MKLYVVLWERHLAAMIVAGSHSHKGDTSLPNRMATRHNLLFNQSWMDPTLIQAE